jgi:hypothetical protein
VETWAYAEEIITLEQVTLQETRFGLVHILQEHGNRFLRDSYFKEIEATMRTKMEINQLLISVKSVSKN